jgi:polyhydroxyalkanoate synthase
MAASAWTNCGLALPSSKTASIPWRPELTERAAALANDLADIPLSDFAAAVGVEIRARAGDLIGGLEAYRGHPYRRTLTEPPVLWAEGRTRVLDYGPGWGRPILMVPSLINRFYILDLAEGRSLARYLAARGFRPLVVDWGAPGPVERGFDLTAYVAGRLDEAFEAIHARMDRPIAVLGYCMGGDLALALALRQRARVAGLVLMATPWDFHAGNAAYAKVVAGLAGPVVEAFEDLGAVPTDVLQGLFFLADPTLGIRKFSKFRRLDPAGAEALAFVQTEDWLNDGVPLALPVARECFGRWYGENDPARLKWRIAGRVVDPAELNRPCLVVVPARDRLVPPESALPLAARIPGAEVLSPDLGHIGLMVGTKAPDLVWDPLVGWLDRVFLG